MKNEKLSINDGLQTKPRNYAGKISRFGPILKYLNAVFAILAFLVPLVFYIVTLQPKLIGGDTTWYAIQVPLMDILVPTGYPAYAIAGKLFSLIPVFDLAYRLNLMSAVFGALTILFLFLSINKLTKNAAISLISALTFAYTITFWSVANRFEMDTINSFFIALLLYAIFKYEEIKDRKHLYFCFAALGLLLTDHPIAFFVMPAMLLFVIIINPKIFKSIKAVILSIIYFILPLGLYAWLPIRSLQGHGAVKTARDFFLYVTGRNPTGEIVSGSIFDKGLQFFMATIASSFKIIYANFGIILLIVSLLGLYYSFRKNWKFSLCSLLAIISSLLIIALYSYGALENFLIDTILIITFYIAMGLLFIFESSKKLFVKVLKTGDDGKPKGRILYNSLVCIVLIIFLCAPALMAGLNFKEADSSKIDGIYFFWSDIFNNIQKGSSIYVASTSANIGAFIDIYEQPEKEINYVREGAPLYNKDNISRELKEGKKVYLANIADYLIPYFNIKLISTYRWPKYNENISFYEVTGEKLSLKIIPAQESLNIKFGDAFNIEYEISNPNDKDLKITSLELVLPASVKFVEVGANGSINQQPGLSQGKYMWVKDYIVKAGSKLSLVLNIKARAPGQAIIKLRITSQDIYMDSPDIIVNIEQ